MSYNALITQRRGVSNINASIWESAAPPLRIPIVTGVEVAQEIPGGYTTCDFTIPARYARYDIEDFRQYHQVQVCDGTEEVFHGYTVKPVRQRDGGIRVTCNGMYRLLDETLMRIVWSDGSIGDSNAPGSAASGDVSVNSYGNIVLTMPKDHAFGAGSYVGVDYYLFDEAVGTRDGKKIDGFHIIIDKLSTFQNNSNLTVRVLGMNGPNDSPDTLQGFTAPGERKETSDASSGDNSSPWLQSTGYRLVRVALMADNATSTLNQDRSVVFSGFRVTTRGRSLGLVPTRNTGLLVRDLFDDAASRGMDIHQLLQEEHSASTGESVVGNILSNNHVVSGVAYTDWVHPREIIEYLAATGGTKVGMWGPTEAHPPGSYVVSSGTTRQYWHRQPAELIFEDWPGLGDPDYTIRLQRGAQWEPDQQDDELQSATYVNYQTRRGRQASVFAEDADLGNYLYSEGWHRATDWQLDPPVQTQSAQTLGDRYNSLHRQPVLSGQVTIPRTAVGAIEGRGGQRLLSWSRVRPGVCRIVDAKGPQAGRITRVEFSGSSGELRLWVNSPASERLDRRLAQLSARADKQRLR